MGYKVMVRWDDEPENKSVLNSEHRFKWVAKLVVSLCNFREQMSVHPVAVYFLANKENQS
jgi:hypothetical protein